MTAPNAVDGIESRATTLFQARFAQNAARVDRLFAYLMLGQWAFAIFLAFVLSPYGWAGKTRAIHAHVQIALAIGFGITFLPVLLAFVRPGRLATRLVISISQMLWSALLIHLSGGRIETHFHVFGSLAFLSFYRDWRILVPATVVVALDHLLRQIFWPESVYGILAPEAWRFLEHAGWVVFEDVFLVIACVASVREMKDLAHRQARIEKTEGVEREMAIASRIQSCILPRNIAVRGLDVSARMVPAATVGGDYYDVLTVRDGCWIAIGDVAGHGVTAGLIGMQAQSALEALVTQNPNASPRELFGHLNRVLFENVRNRLQHSEFMTMCVLRYYDDGRVVIAGAHEEIVVCRSNGGETELVPVRGTWLAGIEDVLPHTTETTLAMAEGDVLVLFTDGVTEAKNSSRKEFGIERLTALAERHKGETVDSIRDRIFEEVDRWTPEAEDDRTLLVLKRSAAARGGAVAA